MPLVLNVPDSFSIRVHIYFTYENIPLSRVTCSSTMESPNSFSKDVLGSFLVSLLANLTDNVHVVVVDLLPRMETSGEFLYAGERIHPNRMQIKVQHFSDALTEKLQESLGFFLDITVSRLQSVMNRQVTGWLWGRFGTETIQHHLQVTIRHSRMMVRSYEAPSARVSEGGERRRSRGCAVLGGSLPDDREAWWGSSVDRSRETRIRAFSSKDQAQRQVVIDKPYELNTDFWEGEGMRAIEKLDGAAVLIVHGKLAFEKAISSKDQAQRQVVIDKPYELNKFGVRHWARQRTPRT